MDIECNYFYFYKKLHLIFRYVIDLDQLERQLIIIFTHLITKNASNFFIVIFMVNNDFNKNKVI